MVTRFAAFSTHEHLSAANGSSATVSRSDIRLIQYLGSSALGFGLEVALYWLFPYPLITLNPRESHVLCAPGGRGGLVTPSPSPCLRVSGGEQRGYSTVREGIGSPTLQTLKNQSCCGLLAQFFRTLPRCNPAREITPNAPCSADSWRVTHAEGVWLWGLV
jgi:hypothetical protein